MNTLRGGSPTAPPILGGRVRLILGAATLLLCGAFATRADEAGIEGVRKQLAATKDRGEVPDEAAFARLVDQKGLALTDEEYWEVWRLVGTLQAPAISRSDLAAVIRTKRESISEYRATYRVEHHHSPNYCESEAVDLAFAEHRRYLNIRYTMVADSPLKLANVLMGYDGASLHQVYPPSEGKKATHASIAVLDAATRERFMQLTTNPLAVSMLVDSAAVTGEAFPIVDLVALLGGPEVILFEKPVPLRGAQALVLSNIVQRVFVDPAREYAVLRIEEYNNKDHKPAPYAFQDFEDLTDHGNGLWLPHRITRRFFDESTGKERYSAVITVKTLSVNKEIDRNLFTKIIPDGVLVGDATRKITYIQGNRRSIAEALAGAIPRPPPWRSRWRLWLIAMNTLAVGLSVVLYSRMRRRSQSLEG